MDQEDSRNREEMDFISPFLSIALGGNPYLHPYITEIYNQDEWAFYEAYQKSSLNGNPLFAMFTTKNEEKIRQAAGIIEYSTRTNRPQLIEQLIKKGYRFVFKYVQNHQVIDFDHFLLSFTKKKTGVQVEGVEYFYQMIVLWYLCIKENKSWNMHNEGWRAFQEELAATVADARLGKFHFSGEAIQSRRGEIDELYREYGLAKNISFTTMGAFLELLLHQGLKESGNAVEDTPMYIKHIYAFGGWLKTLSVNDLDATKQSAFSQFQLDGVFLHVLHAREQYGLSRNEQDVFFVASLYLQCLSGLYLETKQLYLDQSKQDFFMEIKAREEKIAGQEVLLEKQRQELLGTKEKLAEANAVLEQELRMLRSRVRQLEQELEARDDYAKEVHALREYVYVEEQDSDHEPDVSMEEMLAFIGTKRIAIFGGHPSWRNRLKQALPSVEFYEAEERNRDIARIKRLDAVFVNTSVFGHSFYEKVLREIANSDVRLFYLNGKSNLEKTVAEIYGWLSSDGA